MRKLPPSHSIYGNIEEIRKAGVSAANLVRQLLAFSRRRPETPVTLDLNRVVLDLEMMFGRLIGEDVVLKKQLESTLKPIFIEAGQLEQVLLNLVINAREAMPAGGVITLETRNITLYPEGTEQRLGLPSGEYVALTVHDTGGGIPEDVKTRLFEPFFTTNPFGEGAGFGLATCYAIVRQNSGYIAVDSTVGAGSSFHVYLPVVQREIHPDGHAVSVEPLPAGNEHILLVEDDPGVRTLAVQTLLMQGYTVLEDPSAMEAILMLYQNRGKIDMLVTDIIMPQMSGKALADVLRADYPQLKVLFMTGYSPETVALHGVDSASMDILSKPFAPQTLLASVRRMLDGERPETRL